MNINRKMKIYNFLDRHHTLKICLVKPYRKFVKKYTTADEYDYNKWIIKNEPNWRQLKKQKKTHFDYCPKISIVVPLFNTKEYFMKEIIECLKKQTYSNWELCLADGSPEPLNYIETYLKDERIKYKIIGENKGISGNTNEAIKLATGDYIGLLDHDDLLTEFAFFEVVKAINEHLDAEFIYSDEDRIEGEFHKRFGPVFKPDFSKYTLRSANYICHFCVFKKELMEKLGGLKSEYDGSQDFDIVLRASELTDKIYHIPKILYHWRVHQDSTAGNADSKPYAYEAAKNVIKDHLSRFGIKAQIDDGITPGSYKVKYIVNGKPEVSIIIDARDSENTANLVKKVKQSYNYNNVEVIVISENYKSLFTKVVKPKDNVFEQYNEIVSELKTDYFIIVDDNFVNTENKEWINDLLGIAQNDDVGIVGSKLFNEENAIEHCGIVVGMNGAGDFLYKSAHKDASTYLQMLKIIHNVSSVYIKYALINRNVFIGNGKFDLEFSGLLTSIDTCLKMISKDKQVVVNPQVEICVKQLSQVQKNENEMEKFIEKWKKIYDTGDKYYSTNLSRNNTGLSINI